MIQNSFDVKTIGEILRDKRKHKGLHIKQAAENTRIRIEYLKALENGDYSVFSSEVYIRGFLKNYAKFLGISKDKALAMYRREHKETQKAQIELAKSAKRKFDFTITPGKLIAMIVSIVTISIVYYISSQVSAIVQKPELSINSPITVDGGQTGKFSTVEDKISIKGNVSAGSTLKLNGDKVSTNNLERFEILDEALNIGENEFVFIAESQFGRQTKTTLIITKQSTVSDENIDGSGSLPQTPTTPPVVTKMIMTVQITGGPANVNITADGISKINQVLNDGTSQQFEATSSLTLVTPRPAFVKITINEVEYPITTGNIHEWKLENSEIKKIR